MKTSISQSQLTMLVGNFIFAGTLISVPQVLVQKAEQNTWMVPFIVLPVFVLLLLLAIGKKNQLQRIVGETKFEKIFGFLFGVYLAVAFIRDIRAFTDFVVTSLLPSTPIEVLMALSVLTIVYMSYAGIEVIARVTVIQFVVFAAIILFMPLLLLNEISLENVQPIFGMGSVKSLVQSSFLLFGWFGEVIVILLLLFHVNKKEGIRKSGVNGMIASTVLLVILIFMSLTVLGADIVKVSTFPNYQLIQQINITDFLDRLDLVIVTVWAPTLICKMALSLYCINISFGIAKGKDANFILPMGLFLGVFSIVLFKSNVQHLEFAFFSWPIIGLLFEVLLIGLFMLIRKRTKKNHRSETEGG
jgi:spore germination protein